MLKINDLTQLYLGIQGENKSRTIVIDVADWLVSYPNGSLSIWIRRPGDATATATGAVFDADEKTLTWQPDAVDTYVDGEGTAEIRLTEGTVIKKTREIRIAVSPAVTGGGSTLGSDWQSYIDEVDRIKGNAVAAANAAGTAAEAAEAAAVHSPYINMNNYHWMVWDAQQQEYVDSGVSARGEGGGGSGNLPSGGLAGQYLQKVSGDDYDVKWESPVNNLTETTEGKVLDASQGKVLKDAIDALGDEQEQIEQDITDLQAADTELQEQADGIQEQVDDLEEAETALQEQVDEIGGRRYLKSVNNVMADEDGNANITTVDYAYGIASDAAQSNQGDFIRRTTGGSSSVGDGNAWLATIRGGRNHAGQVPEGMEMTVTPATREEGETAITAVIDWERFKAVVLYETTSVMLIYTDSWNINPSYYGITITGDPISGDTIEIEYTAEERGTITNAQPTSFVSTGWNLYNHADGYARVLKYSDTYGYRIDGAYTRVEFSTTLAGTRTTITPVDGAFDIEEDGYVWVTGGDDSTTCVYMTWSDWQEGYEGEWEGYTEDIIDLTPAMLNFPAGLLQVGGIRDTIDFDLGIATSYIERIAYTEQAREEAEQSGREWECDENWIYIVRATPVQYTVTLEKEYHAFDHGCEYFGGTTVPCYVSMLYGENLVDKMRHDLPNEITAIKTSAAKAREAMTYVVDGNKSARAIPSGAYFQLINSSIVGKSDGAYTASQAIPANQAIDSSYFNESAPIEGGAINSLSSKFAWKSLTPTTGSATMTLPDADTAKEFIFIAQYGTSSGLQTMLFTFHIPNVSTINGLTPSQGYYLSNGNAFCQISVNCVSHVALLNQLQINGTSYLSTSRLMCFYR